MHISAGSKEREHRLKLALSSSYREWGVARAVAGIHCSSVAHGRGSSGAALLFAAAAAAFGARRLFHRPDHAHGRAANRAASLVVAAVSRFVERCGAFYEGTEVSSTVEKRPQSLNLKNEEISNSLHIKVEPM